MTIPSEHPVALPTVLEDLRTLLGSHRFQVQDEKMLQAGIERVLREASFPFEREVELTPRSRVDFLLCGVVGVEVKISGLPNDVLRQLARYAEVPRIEGLVLVTTRMTLAARMPSELAGKPLAAIYLPAGIA